MGRSGAAVMKSVLFEVSPLDSVTYITVPLVLAASVIFQVICRLAVRRS